PLSSRMDTLCPCHSFTPKSISNSSVIVYHGIFQPLLRLQPLDVLPLRARYIRERGTAGVQMGQVRDLIGAQRAAAAGMLGPAEHAWLEEGAVDDQLPAAFEQVEQANVRF